MKYPCAESTIDLNLKNLTIRLWIDETNKNDLLALDYRTDIVAQILDFVESRKGEVEPQEDRLAILNFIESLPDINAVQIIEEMDGIKYGVVVYLVDFSADVHG